MVADSDERAFDKRIVVLERNKLLNALSLAFVVGGPLIFILAIARLFPPGFIGIHLAIGGAILRFSLTRYNTRATKRSRNVRADKEGVFVDGVLVTKKTAIADGFFQPRRQNYKAKYQSSVRLVDKRRRILFEAEMEDENEALDLLHALGLDPGSRRAEFGGGSPLFATVGRQMAVIFGTMISSGVAGALLASAYPTIGPLMVFITLPLIFAGMFPSKITVGVDG